MVVDIHKHLGPRRIYPDFAAVLHKVRAVYSKAYAEGSTGPQRSWWIRTESGTVLIGHSWPVYVNRPGGEQYLRLKTDLDQWDRNIIPR